MPGDNAFVLGRPTCGRAPVKADSIVLASRASAPPLMVSALSRALYAGTQVLFCPAMTLGS